MCYKLVVSMECLAHFFGHIPRHVIFKILYYKFLGDAGVSSLLLALKEKEDIAARSQSLEVTITQVCNSIPELHIPEDAATSAKVQKLADVVRQYKDEVGQVTLDFQMKISQLQLKL